MFVAICWGLGEGALVLHAYSKQVGIHGNSLSFSLTDDFWGDKLFGGGCFWEHSSIDLIQSVQILLVEEIALRLFIAAFEYDKIHSRSIGFEF